ncbi:Protein of unknown function [Cognatiyoonia koreensis]|uniref:Flagellar protein n=1 Tax=Cognatiyoonia koreensis TaxID=364200 RepID=A0A1I0RJL1_9RHOB|nr:DUF1217 domain-containing protein [Cognatiyoonia koreensis]SEW41217.1 Protein of unknown function [Cognatiyoonia koreensis]
MTFQPVVPFSGYTGWRFLERTLEKQQTAFNESVPVKRATDYFRDTIGTIQTAEDLMKDRRLLTVALGAFGLDDDVNNTFFIRKVLEDGTISDDALANRLADQRYREFSRAFGFGGEELVRTGLATFAETIIDRFEARQFERAVGEQDNNLRIALNLSTALNDITTQNQSDNARWFAIMGSPPVRQIFEGALGLPSSIARIDLDQQLDTFKRRANATFGTDAVGDLQARDAQEKLIRLFLVRSQIETGTAFNGNSIALTLLRGG